MTAQESGSGTLIGVGAGLVLIILRVLQSLTGSGVFGTRIVTTTVTSSQQATGIVSGNFAEHMLLFNSRNLSAIVSEYEGNATVTLTGQADGWKGSYTGMANITRFMEGFLFGMSPSGWSYDFDSFTAGNVTQAVMARSNNSANVNSTFGFLDQGIGGKITGTVSAQDSYAYSATNRTWLISHEIWNFTNVNAQPRFIA